MRTNKMFELGEFRLPRTRMAHAWVCVCECVWVWGLLQSFPSGQAEAVLYFFLISLFLSRKEKSPSLNPTFRQHSAKPRPLRRESSRALTPRTMPAFGDRRIGRLGGLDMRGTKGDVGLPSQPVHDFSPTPCRHLTRFPFSSWQGGMLPGGRTQ